MSLQTIRGEWAVALSALVFVSMLMFASYQKSEALKQTQKAKMQAQEIKYAVALKKIYDPKKSTKALKKIEDFVSKAGGEVQKRKKRAVVEVPQIAPKNLDKLLGTILSAPFVLEKMYVKKVGTNYSLYLEIRW